MFFRRAAVVDAIRFDGSAESAASAGAWGGTKFDRPKILRNPETGNLVVDTPHGVEFAHPGDWITIEPRTGALRVVDDETFTRDHEPIGA